MSFFSNALGNDDLASQKTLRIATYNILSLFQTVGKYTRDELRELVQVSQPQTKEIKFAIQMAKMILSEKLDVVVMQEVENRTALNIFNHLFLKNQYNIHFVEGNDVSRGMHIAYLVKKDLPMRTVLRTNAHERWFDPVIRAQKRVFARDLPALLFFDPAADTLTDAPILTIFGTHFKSKRSDASGSDLRSSMWRKEEVQRTAKIISDHRLRYGYNTHIILAGDMNGSVNFDAEFMPLWRKAKLEDAFNVLKNTVSRWKRVTHTYHPKYVPPHIDVWNYLRQLDAVLVSKDLQDSVLDAKVYRYLDEFTQKEKPYPRSSQERHENPSDHFPVIVEFNFERLYDVYTHPR